VQTTAQGSRREVEAKYRVGDERALIDALRRRGVQLSAPVKQDDQAYAPVQWRYGMSKIGVPFARLRTQSGQHLFTVKRPIDNEMICLEHETVVADRGQMHAALLSMGFRPTVRISKSRRSARCGELSLCLDAVDGLGAFVEVEMLLGGDESGKDAQVKLDRWVSSLSIPVQRVTETYDSLIRAAS
jgi:adenylate cyclase, class 2